MFVCVCVCVCTEAFAGVLCGSGARADPVVRKALLYSPRENLSTGHSSRPCEAWLTAQSRVKKVNKASEASLDRICERRRKRLIIYSCLKKDPDLSEDAWTKTLSSLCYGVLWFLFAALDEKSTLIFRTNRITIIPVSGQCKRFVVGTQKEKQLKEMPYVAFTVN